VAFALAQSRASRQQNERNDSYLTSSLHGWPFNPTNDSAAQNTQ
jgi:hypothetical protein